MCLDFTPIIKFFFISRININDYRYDYIILHKWMNTSHIVAIHGPFKTALVYFILFYYFICLLLYPGNPVTT